MKSTSIACALVVSALLVPCTAARADGIPALVAGIDTDVDNGPFEIPFDSVNTMWTIDASIIFNPVGGAILKNFDSPSAVTGAPLQLTSGKSVPIVENWQIHESLPGIPPSRPVTDWHEIILTPGWVWTYSNNPPDSLITLNGQPWPNTPDPNTPPNKISVVFPVIYPGDTLDIHKSLRWLGTPNNPVWGDSPDESFIQVIEYPSPEPTTLSLLGLAGLMIFKRRSA
jgi:hypothetical protein